MIPQYYMQPSYYTMPPSHPYMPYSSRGIWISSSDHHPSMYGTLVDEVTIIAEPPTYTGFVQLVDGVQVVNSDTSNYVRDHYDEFFEINDELMRVYEYLREMEEQVGGRVNYYAGLDTSNVRDHYDDLFEIDEQMRAVSYEDLLEMEERVGRVNVGLSEETISKHLKTSSSSTAATRGDDHSSSSNYELEEGGAEICVVCQYEYEGNETVGTLHCGHHYHADCIKEWLLQHNVCPICKSTALRV